MKFAFPTAMLCAAIHCESTRAAFVNITIENENTHFANHPNMVVRNAWNALGGTLDVYRVYANFDSNAPIDHVHSVFGSPTMPAFLMSSSGQFWNYTEINQKTGEIDHWDWPESPGIYTVIPELAWDTFPTIGFTPSMNQGGMSGPFTVFNHFQGNWVNIETFWTHSNTFPGNGDALPNGPSGFRVGLFQATVAAGVDITGQFALDTGHGIFWGENTYFTTIPVPGSVVILALPLFTARRRRRAISSGDDRRCSTSLARIGLG